MKIRIVEPVILEEKEIMQEYRYLKGHLDSGIQIDFDTITHGFEAIETEAHMVFNNPDIILKAKKAEEDGCDGVFINCFADPGVYAAREIIKIPVFGGFLPSVLTAASLSGKACIIATDQNGVRLAGRNLRAYGLSDGVEVIKNVGLGVLELNNKELLLERLMTNCIAAIEEHRINVFILGCTGMSYIAEELRHGLKSGGYSAAVVEPLATGVRYLVHILGMGLTNSLPYKIGMDRLSWNQGSGVGC